MDQNSQEPQESELENPTTDDVVAVEASSPDVTDGVSSSDTTGETEETDADKIRAEFLKKYGEEEDEAEGEEPPAGEEAEKPEAKAEETEEPEKKDPERTEEEEVRLSDKEFKELSPKAQQRMGMLNARAKKAERQNNEYKSEVETFRDRAERFDVLQNFAQENQIQPENISKAYDFMARLSQNDLAGAKEIIAPFWDMISQGLGETYAPDLQQQVDDGHMTEDAAKQITKERLRANTAEAKAEHASNVTQERDAQESATQTQADIVNAVNSREAELRASDPNYALKAAEVKRLIGDRLSEEGYSLRSSEQAVNLVNWAHKEASLRSAAPKPAPKPTRPRPTSTTVSRGQPQAASLEDAIGNAAESYVPSV